MAVEQLIRYFSGRRLVSEFEGLRAEPLYANDRNQRVRQDATYRCGGLEIFEFIHVESFVAR